MGLQKAIVSFNFNSLWQAYPKFSHWAANKINSLYLRLVFFDVTQPVVHFSGAISVSLYIQLINTICSLSLFLKYLYCLSIHNPYKISMTAIQCIDAENCDWRIWAKLDVCKLVPTHRQPLPTPGSVTQFSETYSILVFHTCTHYWWKSGHLANHHSNNFTTQMRNGNCVSHYF